MSRRLPAARPYKFYTDRQMEINNKTVTQRQASLKYRIPRSSIILKRKAIKKNMVHPPGRKCIFIKEEEDMFVHHAMEMCKYGFPITIFDMRCIVKTYLDKKGVSIPQFTNNVPGHTWAQAFLKRNKSQLSQRLCSNIKRVRAKVNEETITAYFDNLKKEIAGVEPHLVYNYDETNLVDDPGTKKILTKRGEKYPEAIKNSTKANFSLMMCGNAAGEVLPPYVNYKAENLWDTWTFGGPENTRYNRTKSGWFDSNSFEDWFFTTVLPVLRRQEGKKLIIGDNFSSHLSFRVIKACEEHNIAFVALPPNSTIVVETFLQFLDDKRKSVVGSTNAGRKKKLNIAAGKSISSEELKKAENEPSTSKSKKTAKKNKKSIPTGDDETDAEDSVEMEFQDESEYSSEEGDIQEPNPVRGQKQMFHEDDYVVVEYEGEFWPGVVQSKEHEGAYIKCMVRCGHSWKWPERDDIIFYPNKDIKYKIEPPKKLSSKRAVFHVPELESKWGK